MEGISKYDEKKYFIDPFFYYNLLICKVFTFLYWNMIVYYTEHVLINITM